MTFIYLFLILGVIIFVHELGHFIFAKKAGIYVFEFSMGMGPRIFKFRRKNDETIYSLRLLPIGGFVQMAGESVDLDKDIPKEKSLQAKTWLERFLTISAGIIFNFILAIILLFIVGLIRGAEPTKVLINFVDTNYPAYEAGLREGDTIVEVNKEKVLSIDQFLLELEVNKGKNIDVKTKDINGNIKEFTLSPKKQEDNTYKYGFFINLETVKGLIPAVGYAFNKTFSLVHQTYKVFIYLFTAKLGLNAVAGPIGLFTVVETVSKTDIANIIYLIAVVSVNVGFINLLPFPAFDGGRLLFLVIEKLRGKPVDPKIENIIHSIGFVMLMLLTIFIAYNDIIKIVK